MTKRKPRKKGTFVNVRTRVLRVNTHVDIRNARRNRHENETREKSGGSPDKSSSQSQNTL